MQTSEKVKKMFMQDQIVEWHTYGNQIKVIRMVNSYATPIRLSARIKEVCESLSPRPLNQQTETK